MADRGKSTAEAKRSSLAALMKRGAVWSVAGYGGIQAVRLVSNIILTRLLVPDMFGLMALVSVFLIGLQLFTDVGIGPSIIQHEKGDDEEFLNTAWTVSVLRGMALWAACFAGGPLFAEFYEEPMLASLIPAAGLSAAIAGFQSTKVFTANKHLAMKSLAYLEIGAQFVGTVVMVVWALLSPSVWALVAGGVVTALVKSALSHVVLPGPKNRFQLEREVLGHMIRFGRWVFLSTLITFFINQSDRLVFGRLLDTATLGVYSIGANLGTMPLLAFSHLAGSLLFPAFSKARNEGHGFEEIFRKTRSLVLFAAAWGLCGFVAGGQTMIAILYDAEYQDAGWVVQILAAGAWLSVLQESAQSVLMARGKVNWAAFAGMGKLVSLLVLFPLGYHYGGFVGAVIGFSAGNVGRYFVTVVGVKRIGLPILGRDAALTGYFTLACGVTYWLDRLVTNAGFPPALAAVVVFLSATAFYTPMGLKAWRARRAGDGGLGVPS